MHEPDANQDPLESVSKPYTSRPIVVRLALILVLILFPIGVFAKIAFDITHNDPIDFDRGIQLAVHSVSSPVLDKLTEFATNFGSALAIVVFSAAIILYLLFIHRRRMATILLFGVGGAAALNLVLKTVFERTRPDLWQHVVVENGYSFPSGHAMASSAFAISLIVILWQTKWRWYAVVGGGLYTLAIGLTRVYLGVHYPSDIIGGWCMSLVWVLCVKTVVDRYRPRTSQTA